MRVNFLVLAILLFVCARTQALIHHYLLAGFLGALSVVMVLYHLVRQRHFKRFDQTNEFE
jgi:hypothetical protein